MTRQQAHPSEEVIGRITKRGTLDRRYKLPLEAVEPEPETMGDLIKALACWLLVLVAYFVTIVWAVGVAS
jgi:hypothetical protein